jgi:hypothetical protein
MGITEINAVMGLGIFSYYVFTLRLQIYDKYREHPNYFAFFFVIVSSMGNNLANSESFRIFAAVVTANLFTE